MLSEYTIICDVDGTLCPIKTNDQDYEDLVPYSCIVNKIKKYHEEGVKIVLFSSRNMNSYNGNLGMINKYTAKNTMSWLDKWEIPYDEIVFGKPWPGHKGFYIDDRSVRPSEFLEHSIEELAELCENEKRLLK